MSTLKVLKTESKGLHVRWEIPNFASHNRVNERLESDSFSAHHECCDKWVLICYPIGRGKESEDYFSVFLYSSCEVRASFELYVLKANGEKHRSLSVQEHLYTGHDDWGYMRFMKRADLFADSANLLPSGTLHIGCAISLGVQLNSSFSQIICKANKRLRVELASDFEKLLFSPEFSDVEIVVQGQTFPAHKFVLSTRSPVFKAMFRHPLKENIENKIVISDMEPEVVKDMLNFMYTGICRNVPQYAEQLFFAGEKYEMPSLKQLCELHLIQTVTIENVCSRFLFACQNGLLLLKSSSAGLASIRMESVMKTAEFDEVMANHPSVIKQLFLEHIRRHKKNKRRRPELASQSTA